MTKTRESGTLYINAPLTVMAIDYKNLGFPLANGEVFPILPLPKQTGVYYTFDKNSFRAAADSSWTPGSKAKRINPYIASTENYGCERHKWEVALTDEERDYADSIIQPQARKIRKAKDIAMVELEIDMATALMDYGSTYASYSAAVSNAWNTAAGTPLEDVNDAKSSIRMNAGVDPDEVTMVLGYDKMKDLKNSPAVREQFKYTSGKSITLEMLREFFEVKKIVVVKGVKNTAKENQDAVLANIWTSTICTLVWTPIFPAKDEPSAGYLGKETLYGSGGDVRVRMYRDKEESAEQSLIELTNSWDILETATEAVYILYDV